MADLQKDRKCLLYWFENKRSLPDMHFFLWESYENSTNLLQNVRIREEKIFSKWDISVRRTYGTEFAKNTYFWAKHAQFLLIFAPEDTFLPKFRKIVFTERSAEFFCILWYIHICTHLTHILKNMCHMGAKLNMPKCVEKISGSFGICDFLKFFKFGSYRTIIAQNCPKKAKITGYSKIGVPLCVKSQWFFIFLY